MISTVNSDLPNELANKVHTLLNEFTNEARTILQQRNLNLRLMPMFRNHNRLIAIDSTSIHVVYTTEGISPLSSEVERDFRNKGRLAQQQIVESAVRELGYKDIHYFAFPIASIDASSDNRKTLVQNIVEQYILARVEPLLKLQALGLGEALTYLQNAKARFETRTPEGYADCKANCRNALVSTFKCLSGEEKLRNGTKVLATRGFFGEAESDFIDAFGDLLAKLHGVASKKGSHPPLPTDQEDAELVLETTSSVLNYIAAKALKTK